MKTRIITAVFLALFILFPAIMFSHTLVLPLLASALSCIGVYEIVKCFGQRNVNYILIPSMALGLCVPTIARYTFSENGLLAISVLVLVYLFYMFAIPVFTNNEITFDSIAKTTIMSIYVSIGFGSVILLRDLPDGQYLYILIFIGAWITDIFAYFTGMLFGKHKLAPVISPKKTIEGSIGGIILCTLSFAVYGIVLNSIFNVEASFILYGILGFFASLVSQLGDLITSAIKRHHNTKDYGTIFPGHGGVLDRFDSVIAVAPVLYILCYAITTI